jgi:putative DNA primase/helicase
MSEPRLDQGLLRPHLSTAEDVNPPLPGDPGYEDYVERRSRWLLSIGQQGAVIPEVRVEPSPYFDAERGRMVTSDDPAPTPASAGGSAASAEEPMLLESPPDREDRIRRRTDASNGEFFANLYGDQVRYDHRRRRWLRWGNHWWHEDETEHVRVLAKEAARQRYRDAVDIDDLDERRWESGFAIKSENRGRLEAMLVQARSEPPIADAGDRWDRDPLLLGVANGVVDLRTGHLRRGVPEDRITLHSDITFDPDATCPRFSRYLDEIVDGDTELIAFLQRAFGYSLTGEVSEQCVFLCHGTGANGKTVLLKTMLAVGGGYAANTPFTTFEQRARASIPNDLAALAGKRLVTASETGEDVHLNEARLKAVSGGDPVTARFLHGEFFTYEPVAKFWLAVNHKPRISDDSFGFWRRVRLVPFNHRFMEDADPNLLKALLAELPGILAWAVQGALVWQSVGLRPPAVVRTATEAYRVESDPIADFLAARCLEGAGLNARASDAYAVYRTWATAEGLAEKEMLSSKAFGTRMTERFEKRRAATGNVYHGVGLRRDRSDADPSVGSSAGS